MQWSVDHIVPVKHGGADHCYNYCLMPQRVNSAFGMRSIAKGGVPKQVVVGGMAYRRAEAFHRAWVGLLLDPALPDELPEAFPAINVRRELISGVTLAAPASASPAAAEEPDSQWPAFDAFLGRDDSDGSSSCPPDHLASGRGAFSDEEEAEADLAALPGGCGLWGMHLLGVDDMELDGNSMDEAPPSSQPLEAATQEVRSNPFDRFRI